MFGSTLPPVLDHPIPPQIPLRHLQMRSPLAHCELPLEIARQRIYLSVSALYHYSLHSRLTIRRPTPKSESKSKNTHHLRRKLAARATIRSELMP
ncbi:hypothetical protein Vadar_022213 [Vaccinium darrowii]|uniref:Uncharacterized protein n=1 Tax=Vaccinium darrowii TaxID=229202 RepID=A0ACB7YNV7_9ERIC|nr:hypothetical protein Vadar_022213 [Vaccinium darrowii]